MFDRQIFLLLQKKVRPLLVSIHPRSAKGKFKVNWWFGFLGWPLDKAAQNGLKIFLLPVITIWSRRRLILDRSPFRASWAISQAPEDLRLDGGTGGWNRGLWAISTSIYAKSSLWWMQKHLHDTGMEMLQAARESYRVLYLGGRFHTCLDSPFNQEIVVEHFSAKRCGARDERSIDTAGCSQGLGRCLLQKPAASPGSGSRASYHGPNHQSTIRLEARQTMKILVPLELLMKQIPAKIICFFPERRPLI